MSHRNIHHWLKQMTGLYTGEVGVNNKSNEINGTKKLLLPTIVLKDLIKMVKILLLLYAPDVLSQMVVIRKLFCVDK